MYPLSQNIVTITPSSRVLADLIAAKAAAPEEIIEEPKVTVTVTEDDRPLTDDQVVQKVTGKK